MDILAGIIELLGSVLIGNKDKRGFICAVLACLTWTYVAFSHELYGLLIIVIPGTFINIRNYIKWTRDSKNKV
jgi:nicotinamide riboside transporter PnuC